MPVVCKRGRSALVAAATGVVAHMLGGIAAGATATVTVTDTQAGVTPRYLGYNQGHFNRNSNTSAWVQYSGANAFRVWTNAIDFGGVTGSGDGASTLALFDANKATVRANPESNGLIPWAQYNTQWDDTSSGRNEVQLDWILPELNKLGIEPVMQVSRSTAFSYVGWQGRWEQWKFFYTMAFWAAKNHDVQRYQMYNEPDLSSISISEWNDRLHISSDAVKSAIEDVNRLYGKKLSWSMNGPVAADQDGTVDDWGQAVLSSNRTDYAGSATTYDIMNTYDVHRYGSVGTGFVADQQLFDTKIPQYNASGQNLPVTYTEFNRYNSSTFAGRSDGLDTPLIAAEFGNILPSAMSEDVYGMYAFKFSQTLWDHDSNNATPEVPQKTGFHYTEDSGLYNVKGATRGAEAMRLAMKAFKGERPRLTANISASSTTYAATPSYDPARGLYYYYAADRSATASYTTTLNVSGWNVAAGQVIAVQEVSDGHMGSVSQYLTVPANKIITYTQPASSVMLLTIPSGTALQTQVNLNPTADAQVSHAAPTLTFGTGTTANIDRSDTDDVDDAAYLKFNLGANNKANVSRAYLNVTGSNVASTTSTILHVYGILNDSWAESTLVDPINAITWNNAPNLAGASDAKLTGVGTSAFPVGQLTWDDTAHEWGIDVTDFVRKHPDLDLSFVLIREQRFLGDADTSQIRINTRESASGKPRLSLFLQSNPMFIWNKNANGNWSDASSWDAGVPTSAASTIAVLGDFITSPHTVNFASAATLGELRFDSFNGYTISGAPTLTLNNGAAAAAINVYKGSHTIDVPVALAGTTTATITTGANAALTIGKPLSGAGAVTKAGSGVLTLAGIRTGGLNVAAGRVNIASGLGDSATSVLPALPSVAAGTFFDLNDSRLIVQFGTNASPLSQTRASILAGRNGTDFMGGNWQGAGGISSSAAASADLASFAVGYVENSFLPQLGLPSYTSFGGQTVNSGSMLIRYTLGADCNLDGKVNTDDVTIVGALYNNPGSGHWFLGDFDYDGMCDTDDVTVLGAMYDPTAPALSVAQLTSQYGSEFAAAFAEGQASAKSVVPEPGAVATWGICAAWAAKRRRSAKRGQTFRDSSG